MADYFVVGPTVTLRGEVAAGEAPRLAVFLGHDKSGAEVFAECEKDHVRLACSGVPLPVPARIEALRLFARIAERRCPPALALYVGNDAAGNSADLLTRDGFVRGADGWVRQRGRFLRARRTTSLEEVYCDPFTVPWNFVPREVECAEPILRAAQCSGTTLAVLDVGFGFGKNATYLEDHAFAVYGVEVSATATRRTGELVRHPERFVNASAAAMPFPDASFDAVLDVGCLHCTPAEERPATVREIYRVLKQNGFISSRVFRPRDQAWVERQPFQAVAFGLNEEETVAIFGAHFNVTFWRDDPDMIYVLGKRNPA